MHFIFGDGRVGVHTMGTRDDGVRDIIAIDNLNPPFVLGARQTEEERQGSSFNLNSTVLQFKNSLSVGLLIGELERIKKSIEDAEAKGWTAPDPWNVYLYGDAEKN